MSKELLLQDEIDGLCRGDFETFATMAFYHLEGNSLDPGIHVSLMSRKLEQMKNGDTKRLVFSIPPRYLKTFTCSVAFPAWLLGHNPKCRIIGVSYAAILAEKISADTLKLMKTSWYRRIFPGTIISADKQSKIEFRTTAGGYRFATSVDGTMTGRGADFIIVDDPLKAGEAHSPTARDNCRNWFNSTVFSRFDHPKKGALLVVAQRLHAEDLPGELIESGNWDHLVLPAIQPKDQSFEVLAGHEPVILKAGQILQSSRHDAVALAELKLQMGEHDFEAQYNQAPTPPGGATFKAVWLQRYEKKPKPSQIIGVYQSWDTAYETGEHNDYSVCTTWAICPDGYYLLDVWRGKPQYWELEKKVYELRDHWQAAAVVVESAASGISLVQNIRNRDKNLWLRSLKPEGAKISRAHQQSPKFEQGKIFLPREASWLAAYEHELLQFPYGKHDDQVDSTVQMLFAADHATLFQVLSKQRGIQVDALLAGGDEAQIESQAAKSVPVFQLVT